MHCDRGKTNIAGNNAHGNNTLCVSGSGSNFPDYGIALLVVGAVLIVALLVAFIMYVVFFLSLTLFFTCFHLTLLVCVNFFRTNMHSSLYTHTRAVTSNENQNLTTTMNVVVLMTTRNLVVPMTKTNIGLWRANIMGIYVFVCE